MEYQYSTDKAIQVNDKELSKYGNAMTDLWNIQMPNGGWNNSGRPTRIILNNDIDLIHSGYIKTGTPTFYIHVRLEFTGLTAVSDCRDEAIDFNYKVFFNLVGIDEGRGDFHVVKQANDNTPWYTDQNIYIQIRHGDSTSYRGTENFVTLPSGWHAGTVVYEGRYRTSWQSQYTESHCRFYMKSANDDRPFQVRYRASCAAGPKEDWVYYSPDRQTGWFGLDGLVSGISFTSDISINWSRIDDYGTRSSDQYFAGQESYKYYYY